MCVSWLSPNGSGLSSSDPRSGNMKQGEPGVTEAPQLALRPSKETDVFFRVVRRTCTLWRKVCSGEAEKIVL